MNQYPLRRETKKLFRRTSDRHLRIMIGAHLLWLLMVFLLGAWWGRLVLAQAKRIAELEGSIGVAVGVAQSHWHRTQRMLYWEGATFFTLLLASTILLFWLYWRDVKRSKGIRAFFASVTHELRTPLTSIRLQAESISENLSENRTEHQLVHRLLQDTLRLESQVERTLELARIEGGGPVYTQPLQLKPWVDRFLKAWKVDYREKVEFLASIKDLWIDADPMAMHLIFKNVLENSIKHSKKENVSITIEAESHAQGVALVLRDNGEGFSGSEVDLGTIFQKGPSSQGTGVGLYLIKALMKRMGGRAAFSSNPGFEVALFFREGRGNG